MGRLLRRTLRSLAIAVAVVFAFGYVAGAKPVFAYSELRCTSGYTAQPASLIHSECRPPIRDPAAIQWPEVVTTRDEVALYLANLRVRVFDIDFAAGTQYGPAFDVSAPP